MSESRSPTHLPWRVSEAAGKADRIANRCFYMIAMGKWRPGSRLPAVRQVESEWSVNRQTVLKAYRALAARGLVFHRPNGSYYVAEQGPGAEFGRDRVELENLYEEILVKIRDETDMSPLGVLRMLARMAESKMRESPEIAFVECSNSQATDHAREITERLNVPVLPLVLGEIRGKRIRIPSPVSVLFTTSFHVDEVKGLKKSGAVVVALPIEISSELLSEVKHHRGKVLFLESDRDLARRTAADAIWMMGIENPIVEVTSDIGGFLDSHINTQGSDSSGTLFLIPQKEWEHLDVRWQEHTSVKPISCTLAESAWQIITSTLRIPFGLSL
jgi:DNA-binding transcriptional regulator YhcF (GntR family)